MEKLVYGLWRRPDQDVDPIRTALLDDVAPALLDLGVAGLRINVEEPAGQGPPRGREPRRRPAGGLGVDLARQLRQPRLPHEAAIARAGAQAYGWIVAESEALAYGDHRTWPDGERSPGLSITTFFDKKADVDDEDFYRIWHGEHTPLSFDIHPFWLYVRNQVLRADHAGRPERPGHRLRGRAHRRATCSTSPASSAAPTTPTASWSRSSGWTTTWRPSATRATLQCIPMREWIFRTFST